MYIWADDPISQKEVFFMKKTCLCLIAAGLLSGCSPHRNLSSSLSSTPLSDYLSPSMESRIADNKKPLTLPISVAIITVPGKESYHAIPPTALRQAAEKLKAQLLTQKKYIDSVYVVSQEDLSTRRNQGYMQSGGYGSQMGNPRGVSLDDIRNMYAVDVAIVLSHQQGQRNDQSGVAGLLDISIVGAFVVPGVTTKTSSVIDGMVIHIPSNAIIFRASGNDERSSLSTTHGEESTATNDSVAGILGATEDFGKSLTRSLAEFDRFDLSTAASASLLSKGIANGPNKTPGGASNDYWDNVNSFKRTGGSSFGALSLLLITGICFIKRRKE